ncbi:hypothetical protein LTR91_013103 [Friedmanniomyces endolithicus]|uniref:Uncharacterized protein n=1 Tax=Friedmanniomyces endolithicus TaxID=329885 RepID=A0AAN6QPL7_9PEZI|nr:hypothetical protein LTR38_006356 [Friedmanniomyces endolithicus]KAK0811868.1 hypothetical protein LTR59_001806 [Friedmanniomyces endolithicus]KAK0821557.1 hypothetical protein LTR75_000643 [Friedmanniomyces endolithicus]KAK0857330.1 hypothetical protein LTR03_000820 [Friedmanniomyces endolithicus]KAK0913843.1 hypothetical protein LTR02_002122 [Friedmanniomyces endolithicus]
MTRARGTPLDLTESWDDVHDDDDDDDDETLYTKDDERVEMRDSYRSDARNSAPLRNMRSSRTDFRHKADDGDRRRSARLSVEPDLRMPSSPDAGRSSARAENLRASTPHFRLNNRSMTSDAGSMNGEAKMRASTPRMRLSQRSMTSDAGRFGSKVKDEDDDEDETTQPNVLWRRVLRPLLAYASDVAGMALQNLKPLLGYALLVYILVGALVFGAGFATNTITNALTPICRLPGASYLHLPFCPSPTTTELQGPAEFDKLVQAQSQFEDVLASTQVGANLPMDMKRSEASIRDLKHVVQYSTLPSRNELVFEFTGFIDTARQASQDLSKFNSRIGRAVDQILSTNRWTLSVIDSVSATEASRGALSRWATSNLNIFAPFQPVALSRDLLLDQYLRHTGAVEEQILILITEAQALLNILDNLDGRLDIIASIATRDGIKIDDNKEELFAYLWTKLGGNRNTVAKLAQQSELLKEVGAYRRLAWAHVTTTIVRLQAIRDTLEDLRERVALPEVVGEKVPLEVHIESIRLGIERLEQQREAGRRVEAEGYARVMGRAGGGERREIGGKDGS